MSTRVKMSQLHFILLLEFPFCNPNLYSVRMQWRARKNSKDSSAHVPCQVSFIWTKFKIPRHTSFRFALCGFEDLHFPSLFYVVVNMSLPCPVHLLGGIRWLWGDTEMDWPWYHIPRSYHWTARINFEEEKMKHDKCSSMKHLTIIIFVFLSFCLATIWPINIGAICTHCVSCPCPVPIQLIWWWDGCSSGHRSLVSSSFADFTSCCGQTLFGDWLPLLISRWEGGCDDEQEEGDHLIMVSD